MAVLHPTTAEIKFEDNSEPMKMESMPKFEIKLKDIDLTKAKAKLDKIMQDSKIHAMHENKMMYEGLIPPFPSDPFEDESMVYKSKAKKAGFSKDLAFASKYGKPFKKIPMPAAYYPYDSGPFDDPITSYKTDDSGTEVFLKLVKKSSGVRLVAVNKAGNPISSILEISNDGNISMYPGVDPSCGFQTCKVGRVKIK
jgi:hypothetical protein